MKNGELIRISAGELLCTLSYEKGGISLYSIRDRKIKKNFLTQKRPLFTLTARAIDSEETVTVSSCEGWKSCAYETVEGNTFVVLSGNDKLNGL